MGRRRCKGISPLFATILVMIAATAVVGVLYWLTISKASSTAGPEIKIVDLKCVGRVVVATVQNSGVGNVTLTDIEVVDRAGKGITPSSKSIPQSPISPGGKADVRAVANLVGGQRYIVTVRGITPAGTAVSDTVECVVVG